MYDAVYGSLFDVILSTRYFNDGSALKNVVVILVCFVVTTIGTSSISLVSARTAGTDEVAFPMDGNERSTETFLDKGFFILHPVVRMNTCDVVAKGYLHGSFLLVTCISTMDNNGRKVLA